MRSISVRGQNFVASPLTQEEAETLTCDDLIVINEGPGEEACVVVSVDEIVRSSSDTAAALEMTLVLASGELSKRTLLLSEISLLRRR